MSPLSDVPEFDCFCAQRVVARDHYGKPTKTIPDSSLCPLHHQEPKMHTVSLTPHARQRCEEMGVSTKRVKHALRPKNRSASWPGKHGKDVFVRCASEPELAFIVSAHDPNLVITVLWWSPDTELTREDGKPAARRPGTSPETTG